MKGIQRLRMVACSLGAFVLLAGGAVAQDQRFTRLHADATAMSTTEPASRSTDAFSVRPASARLSASPRVDNAFSREEIRKLMRPFFDVDAQWYAESEEVEVTTTGGRVRIPTYPIFGPPPPLLGLGFEYTHIDAPSNLDLPQDLYTTTVNLSWMRRLNDRWMFRSMLGVAYATDGHNDSSDSWQFRGGGFAIYQPSPVWTWTIGALALGRRDIPVVPAIGLIYQPNRCVRLDLAFPRPRLSVLVADKGDRQHWVYVGAGMLGGTWGYRRATGINDQITYRVWQLALGWESTPRLQPGMPFAVGRRFGAEIGYAFGREFEFETDAPDINLGDTLMIRATMSF